VVREEGKGEAFTYERDIYHLCVICLGREGKRRREREDGQRRQGGGGRHLLPPPCSAPAPSPVASGGRGREREREGKESGSRSGSHGFQILKRSGRRQGEAREANEKQEKPMATRSRF